MSVLKTDYVDDVINKELAADRKFGEVLNEDGTKSYNDVTQIGRASCRERVFCWV